MVQNHLPHDHGQTIEQELEHMPRVERVPHSLENSFERLPLEKGIWRHMKLFLE